MERHEIMELLGQLKLAGMRSALGNEQVREIARTTGLPVDLVAVPEGGALSNGR